MEKTVKSTGSTTRITPRKYPSGVLRLNAVRKDVPEPVEPVAQTGRRPVRHHEKFHPRKRAQSVPDGKPVPESESGQAAEMVPIGHHYERGLSYPEQQQREAETFRILIVAGSGIAIVFVLLSLFKSAF
jgi:hypothetical protein